MADTFGEWFRRKVACYAGSPREWAEAGNEFGRNAMKREILGLVRGCLTRDPSLQKLADKIKEME